MVLTYSCVDALKEIGDIILSSGITGISNVHSYYYLYKSNSHYLKYY